MISTALDSLPTPPCSQLLGWRVLEAGRKKAGFALASTASRSSSTQQG